MMSTRQKTRPRLAFLITLCTILLSMNVGSAQYNKSDVPQEVFPTVVPFDTQSSQQETPVPFTSRMAGVFKRGNNLHVLPSLTTEEIATADKRAQEDTLPRGGLVRSVGKSPLSIAGGSAQQIPLANGAKLWAMAIRSPGAFAIRLHITNFDMRDGSALFYAQSSEGLVVRGPYTQTGPNATGEFWTPSLPGDTAFIEVTSFEDAQLAVSEIVHFDKDLSGSIDNDEEAWVNLLSCHLDVMCYGVNRYARDAVGQMNFVKNGNAYVCTGTVLNDRRGTLTPYFLTAFHCISTQRVTNTLEVVYLWQRRSCGGSLPSYFFLPESDGGTLLATNPTNSGNDMAFIRLAGRLPGGIGLAGWTTSALPPTIVGIHHPGGSWKRVTFQHVNQMVSSCRNTPTSQYSYLQQDSGVIEGGSSGSGIFNSSGQIMGQLLGTCSPSESFVEGCNNRSRYNTVYGKFSVTFPLIRRWLDN